MLLHPIERLNTYMKQNSWNESYETGKCHFLFDMIAEHYAAPLHLFKYCTIVLYLLKLYEIDFSYGNDRIRLNAKIIELS